MRRRLFIKIVGIGLALGSIPLFIKIRASYYQQVLTEPELLSKFIDHDTLKQLGTSYRKKYPSEANQIELAAYLKEPGVKKRMLNTHIHDLIENDFKSGQTVMIDGWILARTEARQCALYSIIQT